MATGVLPVLLGKYTRLAQFFGPLTKTYTGAIRFGFATDTYDADGIPAAPAEMEPDCPRTMKSRPQRRFFGDRWSRLRRLSPPRRLTASLPTRRRGGGETVVLKPVSLMIEEFVIGQLEGELRGVHHPYLVGRLRALGGA